MELLSSASIVDTTSTYRSVGSVAPRFSIIVPVYNVEAYLATCLDSLLGQSFRDYEVIIVNDGSTDSSLPICKAYIEKYPNIPMALISQENAGLLFARRAGVKVAKGEYIMHVDSDDALREDALELINKQLKNTPADMLVFEYSQSESFVPIRPQTAFPMSCFFSEEDKGRLVEAYCKGMLNSMVNKVVKKECALADYDYSDYRGLNTAEDQLQVMDIINRVKTVVYLREPLYWYRQTNSSSITGSFSARDFTEMNTVKSRMLRYAKVWEQEYSLTGLQEMVLLGLLKGSFYIARRKTTKSNYRLVFGSIRSMPMMEKAGNLVNMLRTDIRLFYILVLHRIDLPAFLLCRAHLLVGMKRNT